MFAYDDDDLRAIVYKNIDAIPERPSKKGQWRFRTIVRIALAMRKFEKASATNYKRSLHYVFDKEEAISQLRSERTNQKLHTTTKLLNQIYFIRKFDIDWNVFNEIDANFLQFTEDSLMSGNDESTSDDLSTAYLCCLVVKYLYRNSRGMTHPTNVWNHHKLLNLLVASKDNAIKTELVWTLGYMVAASPASPSLLDKEKLIDELSNDTNTLILSNSEISDEPKAFLLDQLNAIKCEFCI